MTESEKRKGARSRSVRGYGNAIVLVHTGERVVGTLRVTEVQERFAVAAVVTGSDLRVGHSCRRLIPVSEPARR